MSLLPDWRAAQRSHSFLGGRRMRIVYWCRQGCLLLRRRVPLTARRDTKQCHFWVWRLPAPLPGGHFYFAQKEHFYFAETRYRTARTSTRNSSPCKSAPAKSTTGRTFSANSRNRPTASSPSKCSTKWPDAKLSAAAPHRTAGNRAAHVNKRFSPRKRLCRNRDPDLGISHHR